MFPQKQICTLVLKTALLRLLHSFHPEGRPSSQIDDRPCDPWANNSFATIYSPPFSNCYAIDGLGCHVDQRKNEAVPLPFGEFRMPWIVVNKDSNL
jgi:hypothetical protein